MQTVYPYIYGLLQRLKRERLKEMTTLGILQLDTSEYNPYLNGVASLCAENGYDIFRFSPLDVDREHGLVQRGLQYNSYTNKWLDATFPIPKYIYDRCFYSSKDKSSYHAISIVNEIKQMSTFLGIGLPNKWAVHQWLKRNEHLSPYLMPTQLLNRSTFQSYLNFFQDLVLKPISSSGGKGIYFIFKKEDGSHCLTDASNKLVTILSDKEPYTQVQSILLKDNYIIQPYKNLKRENRPFDYRIVLQKGETNWYIVGKGFRVGKENTNVSNIHSGGSVQKTMPFSKREKNHINKQIGDILPRIPEQLEKHHSPLFELGVDLGIDERNKLWILEINSKPGYQTVLRTTGKTVWRRIFSGPKNRIEKLEKNLDRSDLHDGSSNRLYK
ncbi:MULTISPECIES: YheC/YheD family protein [Bacillaceae]|uniref:YheC/YheD family protein n=1 Tax=Evansella alkalicola TaxID=745819 RepID=A0ABS6JQB0_9BACI|nr:MULTISPECIES: YheC/YheD family protein [Bacillaceae]MBU9720741.1 YheC/YheD family protein [Bacillus alkalicola]